MLRDRLKQVDDELTKLKVINFFNYSLFHENFFFSNNFLLCEQIFPVFRKVKRKTFFQYLAMLLRFSFLNARQTIFQFPLKVNRRLILRIRKVTKRCFDYLIDQCRTMDTNKTLQSFQTQLEKVLRERSQLDNKLAAANEQNEVLLKRADVQEKAMKRGE